MIDTESEDSTSPPDGSVTTPSPDGASQVALLGSCKEGAVCADPNAVCINGTCLCHTSYYNKQGVCGEFPLDE